MSVGLYPGQWVPRINTLFWLRRPCSPIGTGPKPHFLVRLFLSLATVFGQILERVDSPIANLKSLAKVFKNTVF